MCFFFHVLISRLNENYQKIPRRIASADVEETGEDLRSQVPNNYIVCDAGAKQISNNRQFHQQFSRRSEYMQS